LNWDSTYNCVVGSFSTTEGKWNDKNVQNSLIDQEIKLWKEKGTMVYPAIVINDSAYRG
jgi:hypothetical protein